MKRKRKVGRPRKFRNGDIVNVNDTNKGVPEYVGVVVKHRLRGTKSEYNIIPLTGNHRRYGPTAWRLSNMMVKTGQRSSTGSIVTFRANEWLEEQLPEGRGCDCHCCVHEAQPLKAFNVWTGGMKAEDYDR